MEKNAFYDFGEDWWFWVFLPVTLPIWVLGEVIDFIS
jgi:hypothetical protein